MPPVTALTIAGSDSGGGAGLQGDLRTFAAFGVHGTTAVTAITAQNTLGVHGVTTLDADVVEAQVRDVVSDFTLRATKTGMLATAAIVERVAALANDGLLPHLVVDPVLVATSGDVLMSSGGVDAYRTSLFPLAEVVTPNLREAAVLCDVDPERVASVEDLVQLATTLRSLGPTYVLVKGGHLRGEHEDHATDVLLGPEGLTVLDGTRVATINDHGTGCSLSAAIASGLALERNVVDATRDAKSFVLAALVGAASWRLGHGRGPIDHLGWNE